MSKSLLPHTPISAAIDRVIALVGRGLSYIWGVLLAIIVVNVVARYLFDEGRIELEELQWHLYSIGFLFGMSYAYQADAHIRVDLLHERMHPANSGVDRAVRYLAVPAAVYCPDFDL